jgi:hypothetical protein
MARQPDILVGAGTVRTPSQRESAVRAGASFIAPQLWGWFGLELFCWMPSRACSGSNPLLVTRPRRPPANLVV